MKPMEDQRSKNKSRSDMSEDYKEKIAQLEEEIEELKQERDWAMDHKRIYDEHKERMSHFSGPYEALPIPNNNNDLICIIRIITLNGFFV